ncbi:MAG: PQQ-binding-like beta-propeller repeat protein [Gemmatimonas sp.]|nr:PQQ-binding-like beta-propeller repeat protein [Gemmatimonas sp.]
MNLRQLRLLTPVVAALAVGACASGPPGELVPDQAEMVEWTAYNGAEGMRYSPLSQIDGTNVDDLAVAWEWESTPVLGEESEFRNQSTPLMVDGVMYFTAGTERIVIAADARTGETKWTYRYEDERNEIAPRANSGRGVSYWSDGEEQRIFVVTPGFWLVALDPATGSPITSFGNEGRVDLKRQLGYSDDAVIGASSPPAIYEDVVAVGPALAVGLAPPSRNNVAGSVLAFDARTGEERWRFHTIPQEGEFGNETWEEGSWEFTGNAGAWAPIAVDHERGLMFLPVEGATGDYYGGHRPGDNLFASSLVAVDALTGERAWHFQIFHHDILDYDNPTAPLLANFQLADGERVEAVVQLTKQAFAYVFRRESGEPVWPIVEQPVPQSDTPGEKSSPTQPIPSRPAGYDIQGITTDDLIDFTPELRAAALEAVSPYRLGDLFAPASVGDAPDGTQGTLSAPGTLGGTNWEGGAFDPETEMLFVGSHSSPSVLTLVSDSARSDMDYILSFGRAPQVEGLPIVKPPYSRITAIDMSTGDHAWVEPAGDAPDEIKDNPALEGIDIGRTGSPGARPVFLATASLLFTGEGSGGQPYLHAWDKTTGELIYSVPLPAPVTSNPMSYALDGKQYIAFWIGDVAEEVRSRLVTLALP